MLEDIQPVADQTPAAITDALLGSLTAIGSSFGSLASGEFSLDDSGPDQYPDQPNDLGISSAVLSVEFQAGGISASTSEFASAGPFTATVENPFFADLVYFWVGANGLPNGTTFYPRAGSMSWVGGDLSNFVTVPLPGSPPALSSLEPYRTPTDVIGGDFVTSFVIDGEYLDSSSSSFYQYQLVYRLTALYAVPEPAVGSALGLSLLAFAFARLRRV